MDKEIQTDLANMLVNIQRLQTTIAICGCKNELIKNKISELNKSIRETLDIINHEVKNN